jgi:hypothetical protein
MRPARSAVIDIGEVARGLASHAAQLAEELFPHGRRLGHEWAVGSLAGEPGQSLRITLFGPKRGLWYDHAAGAGGDTLDLVAKALFDGDRAAARRWGIDWLGLTQMPDVRCQMSGKKAARAVPHP